PDGDAEGKTVLDVVEPFETDANGDGSFTVNLPTATGAEGITATATATISSATTFEAGTSEFSPPARLGAAAPPHVTDVFVRGSAWATSFLDAVASAGLGDANAGFKIPSSGAAQLDELPWTNLNQVVIRFDQPVTLAPANLQIRGTKATYNVNTVAPLAGLSNAYLFTLDKTLGGNGTAGTNGDKLLLDLAGSVVGGTNFKFRFNVQQGDVTRDGGTAVNDTI